MTGRPQQAASLMSLPQISSVTRSWRETEDRDYWVAIIGDGINDSCALAYADVGIAIGSGADVAEATARVELLNGGLLNVLVAIDISRECIALMRQNWMIISVPNTVALTRIGRGGRAVTVVSNGSPILVTGNALRP